MKFAMLFAFFAASFNAQVVITDSGSTNRAGLTVTMQAKSRAAMLESHGTRMKMSIPTDLHAQLMKDLEAAGPLDQLNVRHCAKSVSFGSRTTITYEGKQSPDISCSGQTDPDVIALQKDVNEIMSRAHAKMPASRLPRALMY